MYGADDFFTYILPLVTLCSTTLTYFVYVALHIGLIFSFVFIV